MICPIPEEAHFYFKPIALTLVKVITPQITVSTQVEIDFFPRTSYLVALPQYLYFGTLLQFDSLLQNVPGSI